VVSKGVGMDQKPGKRISDQSEAKKVTAVANIATLIKTLRLSSDIIIWYAAVK